MVHHCSHEESDAQDRDAAQCHPGGQGRHRAGPQQVEAVHGGGGQERGQQCTRLVGAEHEARLCHDTH